MVERTECACFIIVKSPCSEYRLPQVRASVFASRVNRAILTRPCFTPFRNFPSRKNIRHSGYRRRPGFPPSPSPASRRPSLQFEALPLRRSPQNHLLVRAEINGRPAILGVDSGAPVSAIALNRRVHFKLNPVGRSSQIPSRLSINGAFNNVAVAHNVRLGALNLVDEPMVLIDLDGGRKFTPAGSEPELDGILGADILFPTKAILDCQRQMLVLKMDPRAPGIAPGYDFRGFRAVPMHVSSGYNLYVDGKVNGKAAKLMVDTGAFATLLHSRFVRNMQIPLRKTAFTSSGVNLKRRGVQVATIPKLSVGSMDMRSNEVGVIDLEGLIHGGLLDGSPPVAGLLGSELLRRYHAIIDFGSSTLYLKR